ncbi:MAG TPA: hypothetical protein VNA27_06760 [Rubrobacteraceae bacterium]|nr:hypothetical protein [Rubrobacteraceae bacterium]
MKVLPHDVHARLLQIMVTERHRAGFVVAIEYCHPPPLWAQHPKSFGKGTFGFGHVSQRSVEDDDIKGFIYKRQRSSVSLLEGRVR